MPAKRKTYNYESVFLTDTQINALVGFFRSSIKGSEEQINYTDGSGTICFADLTFDDWCKMDDYENKILMEDI